MGRRPTYTAPVSAILSGEQIGQAITRLTKRLEQVREFEVGSISEKFHNPELKSLQLSIDDALTRTYGRDTVEYNRYQSAATINLGSLYLSGHDPDTVYDIRENARKSLEASEALLAGAIDSLTERAEELGDSAARPQLAKATRDKSKVFIVHGHDVEAKEAVARFLILLGIEPVILHEQASQGQTIIEKIEANSDVGFVIVLMTPDDVGGKKGEKLMSRPRQNVVLELGYFIGALGRRYVYALRRGNLELPSDFLGVLFEEYDVGNGWKMKLGKELRAAGFTVDGNVLIA